MTTMQQISEQIRTSLSIKQNKERKKQYGQFFTPSSIASFMVQLFNFPSNKNIKLLDAGAGIGSLSVAFLERFLQEYGDIYDIELDAFEIDCKLHNYLEQNLRRYQKYKKIKTRIVEEDFIDVAVDWIVGGLFSKLPPKRYTHAIMNPPYKKIASNSHYRLKLRQAAIETVNLYTAFVALAFSLLEKNGELVAIIPRSFCNGPYYRPFRKYILSRGSIERIHLFHSRNKAFKDDKVLQENVILKMVRGTKNNRVTISTSTDDQFYDLNIFDVPIENIIFPDNPELFIHIPIDKEQISIKYSHILKNTLYSFDVDVSTGPVVDFRVKDHLCKMPGSDTVPLLYPTHFKNGKILWPITNTKKFNFIKNNKKTKKWLFPTGYYCVVRRFSSKEEKRRILASVVEPENFDGHNLLGFENHLNIFHDNKKGLEKDLAYGLAAYLNTTIVDEIFREFSGHTQVNATDLKMIPYPSIKTLRMLGKFASSLKVVKSDEVEKYLMELLK